MLRRLRRHEGLRRVRSARLNWHTCNTPWRWFVSNFTQLSKLRLSFSCRLHRRIDWRPSHKWWLLRRLRRHERLRSMMRGLRPSCLRPSCSRLHWRNDRRPSKKWRLLLRLLRKWRQLPVRTWRSLYHFRDIKWRHRWIERKRPPHKWESRKTLQWPSLPPRVIARRKCWRR